MEIKQLEGAIEAILFTMGDAVELGQIAKAIQQDKPTTEKLIHNLMDKYQDEGRGRIIELENPISFVQSGLLWLPDPDCHAAKETFPYRCYAGNFVDHCV